MTDALDHVLISVGDGQPDDGLSILMHSAGIHAETASAWRQAAPLEPLALPSGEHLPMMGIFAGPESSEYFILAYAHHDETQGTVYHYVRLSGEVYAQLTGDLSPLMRLFERVPAMNGDLAPAEVPALDVPHPPTWTVDKRLALFKPLFSKLNGELRPLLLLLAAALDDKRLRILGYEPDLQARLELISGLMMLLPSFARVALTFSTNAPEGASNGTRIIFRDTRGTSHRWIADFETMSMPPDELLSDSAYMRLLESLWKGASADPLMFLTMLKPLEFIAPYLMPNRTLKEGLTAVAERFELDRRVLAGETPDAEVLKQILTGPVPLNGDLQERYARALMRHALTARDTDAALIIARYMDAHPDIDELLSEMLNEALQDQPDSVYVLVRARLADGISDHWLPWLKAAALCSLDVALKDGDTATLASWLRLISREPAAYELSDIVHEGVLAARERTHEDGELGRQVILIAVRRDIALLDALLNDDALMAALTGDFGAAVRDYDPDAVLGLVSVAKELFLVVLARAAKDRRGAVFTPEVIQSFWQIYAADSPINLPEQYQAEAVIREWVDNGLGWLSTEALEVLLTAILADERDDLFYQLAHHLGEHEVLFPLLATVLQNSGRTVTAILGLIGQLVTAGDIAQQQAVNTYIALLAIWNWQSDALPLVEQMARMIQQAPSLTITSEVAWRLLDVALETRSELIGRVAARRLMLYLEAIKDDVELIDLLLRLYNQVNWSSNLRQFVLNWWREFVRKQPLVNLQQEDKALEGKRPLEEARTIVQTAIALRRVLGKRTLQELADEISTAYRALQVFADAFDPQTRQALSFDQATVRGELDARAEELTAQERKLLAKNFKELAHLIATMADNRTKPSLMRREEDFERQMLTGDHPPQSAIDSMKWLSGYLDGMQDRDDNKQE